MIGINFENIPVAAGFTLPFSVPKSTIPKVYPLPPEETTASVILLLTTSKTTLAPDPSPRILTS